jgi:hypothetical protein
MNPGERELNPWTPQRWLLYTLFAFITQVALVFWLSDYNVVTPRRPRAKTHVHVAPAWETEPTPGSIPSQGDPTLFALVTPHGFSRSAWLTVQRFSYPMTNSLEPPEWLGPPTDDLVDDFDEFVQTNLISDQTISGRIPPALAQIRLPIPVVLPFTKVRTDGGLTGTVLLSQDLPRTSEPILTNTVARLLVDSAGLTVSAVLLSASGVAQADLDALNFAKRARFARAIEATNRTSLIFGDLVFQWFTVSWSDLAPPTVQR